jgi:6-phosphogluconolactonase/glucosamine-6-phosphate isomerase/deaminase
VVEKKSPKYPKNRISMSYSRLNHSHNIFKIINGSSKKKAMEAWLNGEELPINKIYGDSEYIYLCKDVFF